MLFYFILLRNGILNIIIRKILNGVYSNNKFSYVNNNLSKFIKKIFVIKGELYVEALTLQESKIKL